MSERIIEPEFSTSLKWQSVNVTTQVILQLCFIAVLARLIPTDAFGVMAIALVVVGVIEMFAQVGIGPALIQNSNVRAEHKRTAFVFSLGLGIIFFVGTYFSAPYIASFYNQPLLTDVLRWIALSFIISGASVVPRSMLIKEMRFKSLFFCSSTAMIIGNLIVGLTLAYNGAGIWAYVIALLAQNTLLGIGYWIAAPSPIGIFMDNKALREMVGYGGRSTVFNILNYSASKIDTMVVGATTSNWTLTGLYDRSSYLMGLPVTVLGKLGDSVLFSGMSMMQDNQVRLKATVLSAIHGVLLLVLPLTALLIYRAEDFTVILLGTSYLEAVPIVTILFSCVALRSFIKIGDATMRATDHLTIGAFIKLCFLICVGVGAWRFMAESNVLRVAWVVAFSTLAQALSIAAWLIFSLKIRVNTLSSKVLPGIYLSATVVVGALTIDILPINDYLSSAIQIPEISRSLYVLTHILTSSFFAFVLIYAYPNIYDGGSPNMRRTFFGKLPAGKLKSRLTI
jgi:O-antigen/teichoic acid export membrane protein